MSNIQTFSMPDVGEGLTEAEILSWHVAVGDTVTVNQVLVEIETAKAAVELPSPFAGLVTALLVAPGIIVDVGTPIISVDTEPLARAGAEPSEPLGAKIGELTADGRIATLVGYVSAPRDSGRRARKVGAISHVDDLGIDLNRVPKSVLPPQVAPKATPPVRKLARELGIDLAGVRPARADGVISRSEVEAAVTPVVESAAGSTVLASNRTRLDETKQRESRVPIKGVRRLTAQAMVASAFTAPHVTEFLTVDVTPMMELRDRLRQRPEFGEVKLSPLAFASLAVCLASGRTPEINSVWDGDNDEIIYKNYVNLGIAAATPRGLVVPVIENADQLDLLGIAVAIGELTAIARAGRTTPTQMSGGTFTITNVGIFGIDTGTPIINPGESAILALGSIKDAPWVVGGQLAVRKVCQLSLSFDHRVIDGQQGSQFLADVGALIADPALALVF